MLKYFLTGKLRSKDSVLELIIKFCVSFAMDDSTKMANHYNLVALRGEKYGILCFVSHMCIHLIILKSTIQEPKNLTRS